MKIEFARKIWALLLILFCFYIADAQQVGDNSNKNQKKAEKQEKEQTLKIKSKPSAAAAADGCEQNEGTVRLKVTFDKSAKVTDVVIVSPSTCDFFNKQAIKAAKKIKFTPQIKNGEAITVVKTLEYKFTRY